jgi:hypothetical protein
MTTPNPIASQRQQLVKVDGFAGFFATKEGGEVSADVSQAWDGGALRPEPMSAPATTSNVTVTKPYRPAIHGPQLRALAPVVGRYRTTVNVYDTDPDLGPIGEPVTYANALLVRLKRPDHDAGSADPGTFELEFAVTGEA